MYCHNSERSSSWGRSTADQLADLDYDGFRRALIEFGHEAKIADKAVIFYAGHGVDIHGKNWLIPVDAEIKSEIDVYAEGINLETVIDLSVMPKVIGLVILDACRNNPFARMQGQGRSLNVDTPQGSRKARTLRRSPRPFPHRRRPTRRRAGWHRWM